MVIRIIKDVNGMRLKVEEKQIVIGPLTKMGALRMSSTFYPYVLDWAFYQTKLKEWFSIDIEEEYKVSKVSTLASDQTLIYIEFDKVTK